MKNFIPVQIICLHGGVVFPINFTRCDTFSKHSRERNGGSTIRTSKECLKDAYFCSMRSSSL